VRTATDITQTQNQLKKGNMSEEKKEVDVRDLKPSKDAKGGRHGNRQTGGHGKQGPGDIDAPGRGKHGHL